MTIVEDFIASVGNRLLQDDAGLPLVMYHGSAPGRWIQKGSTHHTFEQGCFLSSQAKVASLYAADWAQRNDKHEFIQELIQGELEMGDYENLENLGFLDFFEKPEIADQPVKSVLADFVLANWSDVEISHLLVRPNMHRALYPCGAIIFPIYVLARTIEIIDAKGANWDAVPYESTHFSIEPGVYSTNTLVNRLRGSVDAVWIKNLTDIVHTTSEDSADTMFVYAPSDLAFTLGCQNVL